MRDFLYLHNKFNSDNLHIISSMDDHSREKMRVTTTEHSSSKLTINVLLN